MGPAKRSIQERIKGKFRVAPNGCHEWTGATLYNGYGQIHRDGKTVYAHRAVWESVNGDTGGLFVLHRCDNRCCINIDHLFLGTFNDNMRDMVEKGRQAFGNRNGRRKLCSEQALEIRRSSERQHVLAKRYAVSRPTISDIQRRKSWQHI